jgi:hypothetical protein
VLIHATCIRTLNTHTHTYVYIYTQGRCLPQDQPRGPPRQALGAARVLRRHTHTDQPAVDTHTQTCARPVLLLVIIQHHATTSLYYTTLHQRVCCTSLSSSSSSSSFQYKVPSMHTTHNHHHLQYLPCVVKWKDNGRCITSISSAAVQTRL